MPLPMQRNFKHRAAHATFVGDREEGSRIVDPLHRGDSLPWLQWHRDVGPGETAFCSKGGLKPD